MLAVAVGCAAALDAPPAPAAPSATPEVVAPTNVKPIQPAKSAREAAKPVPAPALDVAALKDRLRSTGACGVFTKLALKNQMDDLLQQFRAQHQSGGAGGVNTLRQPYDMLVLKVLAVVQDGDPSLARMISNSREAIWGILADPVKFNALA
ncbi:MAG TPA: hypothetical protein VF876_03855 [Burkholderiales bacterium]